MGLFSFAKKAFKKIIKPAAKAITQFGGGFLGGIVGGGVVPAAPAPPPTFGGLPGLPALPPGIAAPTQLTGPRFTRRIPQAQVARIAAGAGVACPQGFHPAKDGSGRCVRNRRMNVLNHRAAMRAIRRIKGARKMLMKIERQLPKPRSRPRQIVHRRRLVHEDS